MNSNIKDPPKYRDSISGMSGIEQIVSVLRNIFEHEYKMRMSHDSISHSLQNPIYQEVLDIQRQQMLQWEELIKERLREFLLFPPHHSKHIAKLEVFHKVASYNSSIFIMTKFPEGENKEDIELTRVINAVQRSIKDCGFYPRIASESDYHSFIWDNVELYLLGCCKGVAIVEDRYKPELNPNVAMEWGWMRGMGKDVLFLLDNGFHHYRADFSGLQEYRFSWDDPDDDIRKAIEKWLLR